MPVNIYALQKIEKNITIEPPLNPKKFMNKITSFDCSFCNNIKEFNSEQIALGSAALISSIALAVFVHPAFWAASLGIGAYALFKACYPTPVLPNPLPEQMPPKETDPSPTPVLMEPLSEEQNQLIEQLWPKDFDAQFTSLFEDTPYRFDQIPISPNKHKTFPPFDEISSPFLRVVLENGWYAVVFRAISQAEGKTIMYIRVDPRQKALRFFSGDSTIFNRQGEEAMRNISNFKLLLNGNLVSGQSYSESASLNWKLYTCKK